MSWYKYVYSRLNRYVIYFKIYVYIYITPARDPKHFLKKTHLRSSGWESRRNRRGGITKEESWIRNHEGAIMEEKSWRGGRHQGGPSRRHLDMDASGNTDVSCHCSDTDLTSHCGTTDESGMSNLCCHNGTSNLCCHIGMSNLCGYIGMSNLCCFSGMSNPS